MKCRLFFIILLILLTRCEGKKIAHPLISPHGVTIFLPRPSITSKKDEVKLLPVLKSKKKEVIPTLPQRNQDSLIIRKLNYLRTQKIDLDLNEPGSRSFFFSQQANSKFPTMITLAQESFFRVGFDNDILDYTDRFYTNGIRLDWISKVLQMNPASHLMVPYWGAGMNYYGISLVQNMYTPSTTKTGGILYGDRPYAAYLYLKSFKITNDASHGFRQRSELDLGIIGPDSFGGWVQKSFHNTVPSNNEPLGWEYQIHNDLVLNYSIIFEKGVIKKKYLDLLLISSGTMGTLYTNMSGGFQLRTGWMNPFFSNLGISRRNFTAESKLQKFQLFLFLTGNAKIIGYDATLEGGMINKSSPYTLPSNTISRFVFQNSVGITMTYQGFRFDIEQFLLSPEYEQGWWHKWVHIGLSFCL
ncbi:MAG: lipid A deacylase LpxR family protein [Bacteroidales bacterium]|nr:lipid A deacylase LpxR family protein [Bacteroidales bacterium]